jgi:hypothetical protein
MILISTPKKNESKIKTCVIHRASASPPLRASALPTRAFARLVPPASHFCPSVRRPHGAINYSQNHMRPPPPDHGRRSHSHRSGRRAFRFGNLPIQSIQSWSRRLRRHPPRPVATSLAVAAVNHPITVAMTETGCRLHQDRLPPPSSPRRLVVHIDLVRQPPSALPLQPPHPHHLDGGWVVASRMGS